MTQDALYYVDVYVQLAEEGSGGVETEREAMSPPTRRLLPVAIQSRSLGQEPMLEPPRIRPDQTGVESRAARRAEPMTSVGHVCLVKQLQ
jgi:hypothetical protein